MNLKIKKISIYAAITFLIIRPELKLDRLSAFSGKGPFIHGTITTEALIRYQKNKPFEMNIKCASMLAYLSNENDYNLTFAKNDSYHCDNNNIAGCSFRLNQLSQKAANELDSYSAIRYLGMALHIVQDFYSHSNWVEIFGFSFYLADLKTFQDIPPPSVIQTGYFPDIFLENPQAQVDCYFTEQNAIKSFILGATHDCLNKDSNFTKRGVTRAENSRLSLHELAAEYAIRDSVKLIKHVTEKNPIFKTCLVPKNSGIGCNSYLLKTLNRLENKNAK